MSTKTTQEELIDLLSEKLVCSKVHAGNLLTAFQEALALGIVTDGEARMAGFGTFKIKWNAARQGFNPATGEAIEIPAQNRLIFNPQKQLAEAVNQDFDNLAVKPITKKSVAKPAKMEKSVSAPIAIPEEKEEAPTNVFVDVKEDEIPERTANYISEEENYYRPVLHQEEKPSRKKWWLLLLLLLLLLILGYLGYRYFIKSDQSSTPSEVIEETVDESAEPQSAWDEPEVVEEEPVDDAKQATQYEVRAGDTLWDIAERNYGKGYLWVFLLDSNKEVIKNPDLIRPGHQIVLPYIDTESLEGQITPPLINAYQLAGDSYKQAGLEKGDDFLRKVNLWKSRTP